MQGQRKWLGQETKNQGGEWDPGVQARIQDPSVFEQNQNEDSKYVVTEDFLGFPGWLWKAKCSGAPRGLPNMPVMAKGSFKHLSWFQLTQVPASYKSGWSIFDHQIHSA